jgi:predicted small integral membrane protein
MRRLNVIIGVLGAALVSLSLVGLIPQGLWPSLVGLSLGSVLVYASFTNLFPEERR